MRSSLVLSMTLTLPVIVSYADWEPAQPLRDDLFSDPGLPLTIDSAPLSSDQIASASSDSTLYPADAPESSLLDQTNFNLGLNEPLELADCSASENFPMMGKKSRRDAFNGCSNSATGTGTPPGDAEAEKQAAIKALADMISIFGQDSVIKILGALAKPEAENENCHLFTGGVYPIGVCSAPTPDVLVRVMNEATATNAAFISYNINNCKLGMRNYPTNRDSVDADLNFSTRRCSILSRYRRYNPLLLSICHPNK